LAKWFNKHIHNLKKVVGDVHYMTDQVNASANDIAAAVGEQAAITSQQSASLSQITSRWKSFLSLLADCGQRQCGCPYIKEHAR